MLEVTDTQASTTVFRGTKEQASKNYDYSSSYSDSYEEYDDDYALGTEFEMGSLETAILALSAAKAAASIGGSLTKAGNVFGTKGRTAGAPNVGTAKSNPFKNPYSPYGSKVKPVQSKRL